VSGSVAIGACQLRATLLQHSYCTYTLAPSQATRAQQDTQVLGSSIETRLNITPQIQSTSSAPNITAPSHFLIWGRTKSGGQKVRHVVMPSSIGEEAGTAVKLRSQAIDAGGEPEKPPVGQTPLIVGA